MDKTYTVKITRHAEESLREIARYIAYDLLEPQTAVQLIEKLHDAAGSLSQMPERIMLTPEGPWHSQGIHRMLVKNYYVYFWIDEDAALVQITDVIYARSDQPRRLEEMQLEN